MSISTKTEKYNLTPETTLREYGIANPYILDSDQFISAALVDGTGVEVAINCPPELMVHVAAQLTINLIRMGRLSDLARYLQESISPE